MRARVACIAALLALAAQAASIRADQAARLGLERRAGSVVLVAPPGAERSLESLGPHAQDIVTQVSRQLGLEPRAPYRMILIPANGLSDPDLIRFDRGAPPWAAGFMDPAQRTGAIRLAQAARYPYGTPEAVLAHESAHLLMHDAPGVALPLWFEEGVATWVAREWQLEDVFQLSSRLLMHDLPRLDALEPKFHGRADEADQAYAASFAFVSWSVTRYGSSLVRDVLNEARTHSFERAWRLATGESLDRSESQWRRDSVFRYRWLPVIAGSGSLWLIVMVIALAVWLRRRARARALEAVWDAEDTWDPEAESAAPDVAVPPAAGDAGDTTGPRSPIGPWRPLEPPRPPHEPPIQMVWRRLDDEEDGPREGDGGGPS
jgi:hypothetical protein